MPPKSVPIAWAIALVVPLACSDNAADSTVGTAGSEGNAGGAATSVNASTSDGGGLSTGGTLGSAGTNGDGAEAGSGGSLVDGSTGDDRRFVPEGLSFTNLNGESAAVNLIAFTLRQAPAGPELYAAVRNDGEIWACDASISFELFDQAEQSVGAWIGGLYSTQLFRRSDGSGGLVACIGPGGTAMVGVTDLSDSLAIDAVGAVLYQLTYFDRAILPFELLSTDALSVTGVERLTQASGTTFTGALENGLDVTLGNASVNIFPMNRVGRPLAVATSTSSPDVLAGDRWTFETTSVEDPGVDYVAYPSGSL